jgi:hypothetical protein
MRKIEAIKRELFERIRAQVSDRLGLQDREIKKAERSFARFFSHGWKRSNTQALQKRIEASNVIFWGDFHGVRQFQKNLFRWLKKQDIEKTPIIIALECLSSQTQKWVDQYLKSLISEEEFLKKVKWNTAWGFPWTHYKPLFDWARENKQTLRVINDPHAKSSSRKREIWGVKLISELVEEFPSAKIFVLYGEYHLLPKGFPSLVKKKKNLKPLFVFQNSDTLYFQKPPLKQVIDGEVFKAAEGYFCIQSVTPWVKWQNYNLFLEATSDSDIEEDLDLTEHVLGLSQILSKTLQIPLDPNHYAVFTSDDRALWDHLKKLPENELFLFESLIEENMSFVYLPGDWAFLGRISANETASLAMQALLFQFNPKLGWKKQDEAYWEFLIWIHAFSYLGSKLINPHRKSPTLLDLQKKARTLSFRPTERQAARLAVNYTLHQSLGNENAFNELSLSNPVRFQAVKWISRLLGEKLYNAYNQGALNLSTLKTFMKKNPQDKHFHVVIQNLYELVDHF